MIVMLSLALKYICDNPKLVSAPKEMDSLFGTTSGTTASFILACQLGRSSLCIRTISKAAQNCSFSKLFGILSSGEILRLLVYFTHTFKEH